MGQEPLPGLPHTYRYYFHTAVFPSYGKAGLYCVVVGMDVEHPQPVDDDSLPAGFDCHPTATRITYARCDPGCVAGQPGSVCWHVLVSLLCLRDAPKPPQVPVSPTSQLCAWISPNVKFELPPEKTARISEMTRPLADVFGLGGNDGGAGSWLNNRSITQVGGRGGYLGGSVLPPTHEAYAPLRASLLEALQGGQLTDFVLDYMWSGAVSVKEAQRRTRAITDEYNVDAAAKRRKFCGPVAPRADANASAAGDSAASGSGGTSLVAPAVVPVEVATATLALALAVDASPVAEHNVQRVSKTLRFEEAGSGAAVLGTRAARDFAARAAPAGTGGTGAVWVAPDLKQIWCQMYPSFVMPKDVPPQYVQQPEAPLRDPKRPFVCAVHGFQRKEDHFNADGSCAKWFQENIGCKQRQDWQNVPTRQGKSAWQVPVGGESFYDANPDHKQRMKQRQHQLQSAVQRS